MYHYHCTTQYDKQASTSRHHSKPAKSFISQKYNAWYSDQVARQVADGKTPADVKVSMTLTDIKPLRAQWIVDVYNYLREKRDLIVNGFVAAGISEAVESAQSVMSRIENPLAC